MKHPESGKFKIVGLLRGREVVFENAGGARYMTGETRLEVAKWEDLEPQERAVLGLPTLEEKWLNE